MMMIHTSSVRDRSLVGGAELRDRLGTGAAQTVEDRQLIWLDCAKRVFALRDRMVRDADGKAGYRCRGAD